MDERPSLDTSGTRTHAHAHTHTFVTNAVFQYKHLVCEAFTVHAHAEFSLKLFAIVLENLIEYRDSLLVRKPLS